MRCTKCGTDNREGRKFCAQCGVPLKAVCPSCGAGNELDEKVFDTAELKDAKALLEELGT